MGIKVDEKKEMKKQFAKLSKAEQEKVELRYHQMKPEDFDKVMSRAKRQTPATPRTKRKTKASDRRRAA
jgi:hypothetical protein